MHYLDEKMATAPVTNSATGSMWTTMSGMEQKADLTDCGMMPPPNTTLPLNIRRSSSGNMLSDQLSPVASSCLKVEISDESSQGSLSDGNDPFQQQTVDLLLQQKIMDEKSRMVNANEHIFVTALQPANVILSPQQTQVISDHHSPKENQMQPFLSNPNLMATPMTGIEPICTANNLMGHLYGQDGNKQTTSDARNTNSIPIQFTDHQLTTISNAIINSNTSPSMSSVMDIGLQIETNSNNSSDLGAISSAGSLQRSPLSHDIILNSHNSIINSPSAISTSSQSSSISMEMHHNMSPELILNPSVSPSVLCEPMSNSVTVPAVQTLVEPILNLPQPQPNSPENVAIMEQNAAILDSMMTPISVQTQQQQQQTQMNTLTTGAQQSNVVHNMILNAAAEILSSQPPTITTESMQALISLNNAVMTTQENPQTSPGDRSNGGQQYSVDANMSPVVVTNVLSRRNSAVLQPQNNQIELNLIDALVNPAVAVAPGGLLMQDIKMHNMNE